MWAPSTPCGTPTWTCWPPHSGIDLYDSSWPIYARSPIKPPHVTGPNAQISHSLVTGGCQVDGSVENSVLFHSVTVEEGADVQYSILMPGAVVKKGAVVAYAIVAENAVIGEEATIGAPPQRGPGLGHCCGRRRRLPSETRRL